MGGSAGEWQGGMQQCSKWGELCVGLQGQPGDKTGGGRGPLDHTEELGFTQEVMGRLKSFKNTNRL